MLQNVIMQVSIKLQNVLQYMCNVFFSFSFHIPVCIHLDFVPHNFFRRNGWWIDWVKFSRKEMDQERQLCPYQGSCRKKNVKISDPGTKFEAHGECILKPIKKFLAITSFSGNLFHSFITLWDKKKWQNWLSIQLSIIDQYFEPSCSRVSDNDFLYCNSANLNLIALTK